MSALYDPRRERWPWDVAAIEEALACYGMRPKRHVLTPRVPFLPEFTLGAWCPGCYPGGGTNWLEDAEPTLTVGHVLGPVCRICDLPPAVLLQPLGPWLPGWATAPRPRPAPAAAPSTDLLRPPRLYAPRLAPPKLRAA